MQESSPETQTDTETSTTEATSSPVAAGPKLELGDKVRFALVRGEPLLKLPEDLYIPPDALEVFLDTFEGPLDLLLYLIRRQNLDILDIPIIEITKQYMEYVELMKEVRLELAAEYLVMAAMLCEIKSRMLLPRADEDDEDGEDPRAELVRRLAEYEQFKRAAQDLDALPRLERDCFVVQARVPPGHIPRIPPKVELDELLAALQAVLARADLFTSHQIERESLSLRERMSAVLERISGAELVPFTDLFDVTEGRAGVVVSFLAVLELLKAATLELIQVEPFAPIRLRRPGVEEAA
ncbi:MAG: segregation/condensation protein A [Halochromatium sp.]|nr:segregation/condensation protein A [Halochromatium sp.]